MFHFFPQIVKIINFLKIDIILLLCPKSNYFFIWILVGLGGHLQCRIHDGTIKSLLGLLDCWFLALYEDKMSKNMKINKIAMFIILKTDNFKLWVVYKSNIFQPRKTKISSTLVVRFRFQGYRCKSGIGIFA